MLLCTTSSRTPKGVHGGTTTSRTPDCACCAGSCGSCTASGMGRTQQRVCGLQRTAASSVSHRAVMSTALGSWAHTGMLLRWGEHYICHFSLSGGGGSMIATTWEGWARACAVIRSGARALVAAAAGAGHALSHRRLQTPWAMVPPRGAPGHRAPTAWVDESPPQLQCLQAHSIHNHRLASMLAERFNTVVPPAHPPNRLSLHSSSHHTSCSCPLTPSPTHRHTHQPQPNHRNVAPASQEMYAEPLPAGTLAWAPQQVRHAQPAGCG
jgi:hypothetical protein